MRCVCACVHDLLCFTVRYMSLAAWNKEINKINNKGSWRKIPSGDQEENRSLLYTRRFLSWPEPQGRICANSTNSSFWSATKMLTIEVVSNVVWQDCDSETKHKCYSNASESPHRRRCVTPLLHAVGCIQRAQRLDVSIVQGASGTLHVSPKVPFLVRRFGLIS